MKYKDISNQIDVGTTGIVCNACIENGSVFISLIIPAGTIAAELTIMDTSYFPRFACFGTYASLSTARDVSKLIGAAAKPTGSISIVFNSALTEKEYMSFVYPIRYKNS